MVLSNLHTYIETAKSGGDNLCTNISQISSMAESQLYFHKVDKIGRCGPCDFGIDSIPELLGLLVHFLPYV